MGKSRIVRYKFPLHKISIFYLFRWISIYMVYLVLIVCVMYSQNHKQPLQTKPEVPTTVNNYQYVARMTWFHLSRPFDQSEHLLMLPGSNFWFIFSVNWCKWINYVRQVTLSSILAQKKSPHLSRKVISKPFSLLFKLKD